MKTKMTLALAMIGLSVVAVAGAPGNQMVAATDTPVVALDSTGTWSFGLEALYMMSNTNFQYATVGASPLAEPLPGSSTDQDLDSESLNGDWNWGIEADLSYMFPGSSRDVSASYTYLNQDSSDSITAPVGLTVRGVTDVLSANQADADVDQSLNAATLSFGQWLTVGNRLSLHPFGGVQFADIRIRNEAEYDREILIGQTLEETEAANYEGTSDFEGAGPRAGIDATVHLGSGFSFVGTFAGALLVGDMSSEFEYNQGVTGANQYDFDNGDTVALVPELDAKLGVDYMYAFNPETSMDLQLGYEFVNYFNAESSDALDAIAVNSVNSMSDFNYNGPYLRLQINAA